MLHFWDSPMMILQSVPSLSEIVRVTALYQMSEKKSICQSGIGCIFK